jgi:hypothetical protein
MTSLYKRGSISRGAQLDGEGNVEPVTSLTTEYLTIGISLTVPILNATVGNITTANITTANVTGVLTAATANMTTANVTGVLTAATADVTTANVITLNLTNAVDLPLGSTIDGRDFFPQDTNTVYQQNELLSLTGTLNTAAGWNAGFNLTTCVENTALGAESLYWNQTGAENTAVGSRALGNHPLVNPVVNNFSFCTALGAHAMLFHNTGNRNTAIGTSAMRGELDSIITPSLNQHDEDLAFGTECMFATWNSSQNTCCGVDCAKDSGSPVGNCLFGYQCLQSNPLKTLLNAPVGNSVFGHRALRKLGGTMLMFENSVFGYAAGGVNVTNLLERCCLFGAHTATSCKVAGTCAFGHRSLTALTTGGGNCAFGTDSGDTLITGTNNSIFGDQADVISSAISGSIVLGAQAQAVANNTLVVGSAAVPITTSLTANAGGAALPASPVGFIPILFNGVNVKIPYYNV